MNIAVVGSGRMAEIYCSALSRLDGVKIVAVVGNTAEKTHALAKKHGAKAFADGNHLELLAEDKLDGVILATPEWVRAEPLKNLMEAGLPLLVEKPLATSLGELSNIQKWAKGKEGKFSIVHSQRFNPGMAQAKIWIDQKSIGEIRHISARRNADQKAVQRVKGKFNLAYWLSCHDIDIMRWVTGSEVQSVFAQGSDFIKAILKFKLGVVADLEVSWATPPLADTAPAAFFHVTGTRGMIEINDAEGKARLFKDEGAVIEQKFEHSQIFDQMVEAWINSLKGRGIYPVSFQDGVAAVKVCGLIEESIELGTSVNA